MSFQEQTKFLTKRSLPMMFLLALDVFNYVANSGLAHGENRITVLPCEGAKIGKSFVNPLGRSTLELLHDFADGVLRRDFQQQMHVIFGSAYAKRLCLILFGNPSEISPDTASALASEKALSPLRAKNNVIMQAKECVGHGDQPSLRDGDILRSPSVD
jgi:hypothetical protein